jgi:acyl-CoA hydrolase
VGQQLWRRDLISGDSALVFRDTAMAGIEGWYARMHPHDHRLAPDEDFDGEPRISALSDLHVVDQIGPYLSYAYHADLAVSGSIEWQVARRGVIDLRGAGDATLTSLFGEREALELRRAGMARFAEALDSVLVSRDVRARAAANALGDFDLDTSSFAVLPVDRGPAVEFVAPGRGSRAAGMLLPLRPIPVAPPGWWSEVLPWLPSHMDPSGARWEREGYQVVARDQDDGAARLLLVDSAGREWPAATISAPVHRIYWLDSPAADSTTLRALSRAFDEAALYSEDARTAMANPTSPDQLATRASRPVHESQHETSEIMMPQHANNLGHVFGGVILSMMDRTAAVAAIRHARGACVTVSVDRVDFREPIHVGDLVIMKASVNYAGRTSMEVGVRVEAEDMIEGARRHTNSCYLTFVAIDRNGRPIPVPQVIPETPTEHRRFAAAMERRRRRLEERAAEEG